MRKNGNGRGGGCYKVEAIKSFLYFIKKMVLIKSSNSLKN